MGGADRSEHAPLLARAHVLVSGRVQGVFFRASAAREAARLDLRGWVRNLSDGRVEAVFQGARAGVERMIAWCGEGPPAARVDDVEVAWEAPQDDAEPFGWR